MEIAISQIRCRGHFANFSTIALVYTVTLWLFQRPFGRLVFAIDADGILVEYVEPSARVGPRVPR